MICCVYRIFAGTLILLLTLSPDLAAASQPLSGSEEQATSQNNDVSQLPNAPSASVLPQIAQAQDPAPQSSTTSSQQPASANTPQTTPQTQSDQQGSQQPVGAAAAQLGRTSGGAAAKPAGEALAPARQHRTRSLLVKLGILGGAAVAVGTVVGLSAASPSRPPGAR